MENPIVTITGVSGFLGKIVCLDFLKEGSYKVRGTVRSVNNPKKIDPLKEYFGEYFSQLELVEADLNNSDSLFKAIQGSTYVVHTASPFPLANPKHEDELVKPAVDGTITIMKACQQNKIKRIVITSSMLAVMNEKNVSAYSKSKKEAHKASLKFIEELPADEKFELVTIHPSLIIGPNNSKEQFTSGDIIKNIMTKEWGKLPKISMGLVDVRDVSRAHVEGLKRPEAAGHAFQLCENTYWMTNIGETLQSLYKDKGYDPSTQQVSKCLLGCASIFNGEAKGMYDMWGLEMAFDNSSSKQILDLQYTNNRDSLKDMADSLIASGYIPAPKKK